MKIKTTMGTRMRIRMITCSKTLPKSTKIRKLLCQTIRKGTILIGNAGKSSRKGARKR